MANEVHAEIKRRILVVDDMETHRNATIALLQMKNYECMGCATGEEALQSLSKADSEFPVCILDLVLAEASGGLSGMDVLSRISENYPATRVIVFTAHDDKGREAVAKGAAFYVHKPFSPEYLVNLVDSLVKMRDLEGSIAITADQRDSFQRIFDAIGVEVMVRDLDHNILLLNAIKKTRLGLDNTVNGKKCYAVLEDRDAPCTGCPADCAGTCKNIIQQEWKHNGNTLLINAGPIYDQNSNVVAIAEVAIDVTRRKHTIRVLETIQNAAMSTVDEVAQLVVEAIGGIGYDRVRLYLIEEDHPIGRACFGMPDTFDITTIELKDDDTLAAKAFEAGKPLLLCPSDLEDDHCKNVLDKEGVTYQLQVPLIVSGKVKVGLLSIDNKYSRRPFTGEDLDEVTLLAAAISDAIHNAQEHEIEIRRIRWLEGIREIDQQLASAPNVGNVYNAVARTLNVLMEGDSSCVLIRHSPGGCLSIEARFGDLDDIDIGEHPGNTGIVGRCLASNETLDVHDVWADVDFRDFYSRLPANSNWEKYVGQRKALLVVPVRCRNVPVGACVVHFSKDFMLAFWEKAFVEDIAARVAIALSKLEEQRQIEAVAIERSKLSDLAIMASGVAHGIRNPLAAALIAIEVAQKVGGEDNSLAQDKLEEAKRELNIATSTIQKMLHWVRPGSDKAEVVFLQEVVEDLHEIVAQKLEDGHITFVLEAPEDIEAVYIAIDRIKMALFDLLVNARNAMPDGGELKIAIRNIPERHVVELQVSDTGCGMTSEQVQDLFKSNQAKPVAGGTGLGLYLAQKIIAAAGGTIRCESEPSKGSIFTIELPEWSGKETL